MIDIGTLDDIKALLLQLNNIYETEEKSDEDEMMIQDLKKDVINLLIDLINQVNSL